MGSVMTGRLLSAREVGETIGVHPETVLRWWRAGQLPGYRLANGILRFSEQEIDAWLEQHHTRALEHQTPAKDAA